MSLVSIQSFKYPNFSSSTANHEVGVWTTSIDVFCSTSIVCLWYYTVWHWCHDTWTIRSSMLGNVLHDGGVCQRCHCQMIKPRRENYEVFRVLVAKSRLLEYVQSTSLVQRLGNTCVVMKQNVSDKILQNVYILSTRTSAAHVCPVRISLSILRFVLSLGY